MQGGAAGWRGRVRQGAAGCGVPPPHVLPVLGHRTLAIVAARELDEGLAGGLLALVKHEVHAWLGLGLG